MAVLRVPFKMLSAPAPPFRLSRENTALLLVDFQRFTTSREHGYGKMASLRGIEREFDEYFIQVEAAIGNARRLLAECRRLLIPVIHSLLACSSPVRSDLPRQFRVMGFDLPVSSHHDEICPQTAPLSGELVLPRTTFSPFTSGKLHTTLQQMGVETILLAGMMADTVLAMAAREAADRDYGVILVIDASASQTNDWHTHLRDGIVGGLIRQRTATQSIEIMRGERT